VSVIVDHWFVVCIIIATAGFWACMVATAFRVTRPPERADGIVPVIIELDEERGIRFDTTGYDREQVARTAYRLGRDGGWKP
jgi:hypothetical protein